VFRSLLDENGLTVSAVAETNGISEESATQCLRTLNARGLLRVTRISRWVKYRVGHDPLVPGTAELVRAVRVQLRGKGDVIDRTFKDLTAFTHWRRGLIVSVLARHGDISFTTLKALTGISESALCRHLNKLRDRGLIQEERGVYSGAKPRSPVARALQRLAVQQPAT